MLCFYLVNEAAKADDSKAVQIYERKVPGKSL
jgi:hypothetical protein